MLKEKRLIIVVVLSRIIDVQHVGVFFLLCVQC
jgi:hypothetical protein